MGPSSANLIQLNMQEDNCRWAGGQVRAQTTKGEELFLEPHAAIAGTASPKEMDPIQGFNQDSHHHAATARKRISILSFSTASGGSTVAHMSHRQFSESRI